jgi:hypothetical protein
MSEFKLGDPIDGVEGLEKMAPPVVMSVQPIAYVKLYSPEQLRAWEQSVRLSTGLEIVADNLAGVACETGCSYGKACHSDDSGMA